MKIGRWGKEGIRRHREGNWKKKRVQGREGEKEHEKVGERKKTRKGRKENI
jgi:hypothetical protein